jgi:hypothetical protein
MISYAFLAGDLSRAERRPLANATRMQAPVPDPASRARGGHSEFALLAHSISARRANKNPTSVRAPRSGWVSISNQSRRIQAQFVILNFPSAMILFGCQTHFEIFLISKYFHWVEPHVATARQRPEIIPASSHRRRYAVADARAAPDVGGGDRAADRPRVDHPLAPPPLPAIS